MAKLYECREPDCHKGRDTGHALHRTSPKGEDFEGACTEHFPEEPDSIAVAIEQRNQEMKP